MLGVPPALRKDFRLSDLQFPFKIAGCVLIVDLNKAFSMKVHVANQDEAFLIEKRIEELKNIEGKEATYAIERMTADF